MAFHVSAADRVHPLRAAELTDRAQLRPRAGRRLVRTLAIPVLVTTSDEQLWVTSRER
jgi:hypothetical protein